MRKLLTAAVAAASLLGAQAVAVAQTADANLRVSDRVGARSETSNKMFSSIPIGGWIAIGLLAWIIVETVSEDDDDDPVSA